MYANTNHDVAVDVARIEAEAHALRAATIARFGVGLRGFFSRLAASFTEARRMDAQYRELSQLSDRELADIGITRFDIPAVVAGTFTREDDAAPAPVAKPAPAAEQDNEEELRIAA